MVGIPHNPLHLDYRSRPRHRDLAPWGMAGCRIMAVGLFLLCLLGTFLMVLLLLAGEFRLAAWATATAVVTGSGCRIFWQAAIDIAEDFRCDVKPAARYLILLLALLLSLCSVVMDGQLDDDAATSASFLFDATYFLLPSLLLSALLCTLLTISRRWKLRNRTIHA